MFGSLGFNEILFIMVLALLIFGPKRLPQIGRTVGKTLGEFRRASADLKRSMEVEMRMAEEGDKTTAAKAAMPAIGTQPRPEPSAAPADEAAPVGEAPVGEAPVGEAPVDEAPVVDATVEEVLELDGVTGGEAVPVSRPELAEVDYGVPEPGGLDDSASEDVAPEKDAPESDVSESDAPESDASEAAVARPDDGPMRLPEGS